HLLDAQSCPAQLSKLTGGLERRGGLDRNQQVRRIALGHDIQQLVQPFIGGHLGAPCGGRFIAHARTALVLPWASSRATTLLVTRWASAASRVCIPRLPPVWMAE